MPRALRRRVHMNVSIACADWEVVNGLLTCWRIALPYVRGEVPALPTLN
jgi:hypothetical protein